MIPPRYLGDGVYAQVDAEDPTRIILTTGSHKLPDADNVIYLEVPVMSALRSYINDFVKPS